MLALSLQSLSLNAGMAPAARVQRMQAPVMIKSQALPFLEAPAKLDGSMAGDRGFDPLNLAGSFNLNYMREAELKHGRICMLAWVGYVAVDNGFYVPFAPHVSSLAAHDTAVKSGNMLLLLGAVGVIEALSYNAVNEMMSGQTDRRPGDFSMDPFGQADKTMLEKEISHCRLAMFAFSGVVTQSALAGHGFPYL
uniref:Chloroplast light harvesting protein isoform 14 n=1 Tax=Isochrysis galbana TaxID=37099 RepID=Q2IA65_ISOGA|nr:chloroplast light harvesting protein isoform 14 [Isochrysis galbana]|mmetsp:Transcript_21976/g.70917  ORF Transcript_21976/g.70917 Transcript_21976/m.70917 type:complete len:194 (-) Transcript_21976:322-903(-)